MNLEYYSRLQERLENLLGEQNHTKRFKLTREGDYGNDYEYYKIYIYGTSEKKDRDDYYYSTLLRVNEKDMEFNIYEDIYEDFERNPINLLVDIYHNCLDWEKILN